MRLCCIELRASRAFALHFDVFAILYTTKAMFSAFQPSVFWVHFLFSLSKEMLLHTIKVTSKIESPNNIWRRICFYVLIVDKREKISEMFLFRSINDQSVWLFKYVVMLYEITYLNRCHSNSVCNVFVFVSSLFKWWTLPTFDICPFSNRADGPFLPKKSQTKIELPPFYCTCYWFMNGKWHSTPEWMYVQVCTNIQNASYMLITHNCFRVRCVSQFQSSMFDFQTANVLVIENTNRLSTSIQFFVYWIYQIEKSNIRFEGNTRLKSPIAIWKWTISVWEQQQQQK